jgi:Uma2 family endonuclease
MPTRGSVCTELRLPARPRGRQRESRGAGLIGEASPGLDHQRVMGNLSILLSGHIKRKKLGQLCLAPMEIVLDAAKTLMVQPDLAFVSHDRLGIIRDRIMGAPDLVVDILSWGADELDRTTCVGWFREHGVREYWRVDPAGRQVEVINLQGKNGSAWHIAKGEERVKSAVLPGLRCKAQEVFE